MIGNRSSIASRRRWLDRGTRWMVNFAGIGVLVTILLMLVYLILEAVPLAQPASIRYDRSQALPVDGGRASLLPRGRQTVPVPPGVLSELQTRWGAPNDLTASALTPGGESYLLATRDGLLHHYARVYSDAGVAYRELYTLDTGGMHVSQLLTESDRQVVFALGEPGLLQAFYLPGQHRLLDVQLPLGADWREATLAGDGRAIAVLSDSQVHVWRIDNRYPEASLTSLWRSVWYRDYPEPGYVWQSARVDDGDEPKLSLTPLLSGTLKAALYTMLFAAPLGVGAAVYTAYFMSRPLRRVVKPGIELMEAFPTVVLGFLAGLWLAPRVEASLAGVLLLPLVLVVGVIGFGVCASLLPRRWCASFPAGVRPLSLLPLIVFLVWGCLWASPALEDWFFSGDIHAWVEQQFGVPYQQRNAIVVGIAMGFAVIPTVFSITEDAIFSVPRSLSDGSFALGATQWQTLAGVVLPSASPGIFSALMIGFGRAIGETMIVLMAAGATALVDANPFTGMRTLSANIAMEAPEAIVGSTHFRILFLSALLLFGFTFVVNTLAELVRQRLRFRYARV